MSEHNEHQVGHIVPFKILLAIIISLLILTWLTVAVTYVDLGDFNILMALGIAVVKASLVALYFMHLRYDNLINAIFLIGAFVFVALFVFISMLDTTQYQPNITDWKQATSSQQQSP